MRSWVLPSNPATYDAKGSLFENKEMDWTATNNFDVGDIVYIYEVIPPRGRGGIVYKTEVVRTYVPFAEKLDDRKYWTGQVYPVGLSESTRFNRLGLIGEPEGDGLKLAALQARGFTAPQSRAVLLDKKPELLQYIQSQFA